MNDFLTQNGNRFIGAHMSIAGGVANAVLDAEKVSATALQLFVKNNNQWRGPALTEQMIADFFRERDRIGLHPHAIIAHAGYLINLASNKPDVHAKSLVALEDELKRCNQLQLAGLVLHPGSHLGEGREAGIEKIAKSAKAILHRQPQGTTKLLFENTVGNGTQLGSQFEDLRDILKAIDLPERTGVCLDTCHTYAAGFDLRTEETYNETMSKFDSIVGINQLCALHLNDSLYDLGMRKDRHEHIGKGFLGLEAFQFVLNDPRLKNIPMVLETPKEKDLAEDRENLDQLRSLIR
ncbi:MAG: deoxyribonuclease IV [Sumerlaeia bacterium]